MPEVLVGPEDLERVDIASIPPVAAAYLRHSAWMNKKDPLDTVFSVEYPDDLQTFLTELPKKPTKLEDGRTYSQISLVDYVSAEEGLGIIAGEGTVACYRGVLKAQGIPGDNDGMPFVGWSGTEEYYQRRGFGRRRLITMNAASLLLYDSVLHSGLNLTEEARRRWLELAEEGHAEPFMRDGKKEESYRFTS